MAAFFFTRRLKNFMFTLEGFQFYKDKPGAGISDAEAVLKSRDVGRELDAGVKWSMLSDLTVAVEYGVFFPGKAFNPPQNENADTLGLTLTLTF
ncbi:MAG: alginate export family protein [Candidatus Omnitrophica bacterium]|nr:alginate export family protein [Candidatus Omnitrophota bacterium]